MRSYLANPENKTKHNDMSNHWYVNKYHNSIRFRNKRKKYITNHNKSNLSYLLYQGFNSKLTYEENQLAFLMYDQLVYIV